ncbi:hypothetical protein VIGAN_11067000 [Vigna angularis var. angularis]|uniref:Uncharacterized protein n=1 Tax=Vigna angularis var. angularis TaxID=157739 RepID=A0A0S3T844_PHAAN|nr:hypothetical protein VIGAN_11067000 [Vigna angularis var. angularis]
MQTVSSTVLQHDVSEVSEHSTPAAFPVNCQTTLSLVSCLFTSFGLGFVLLTVTQRVLWLLEDNSEIAPLFGTTIYNYD